MILYFTLETLQNFEMVVKGNDRVSRISGDINNLTILFSDLIWQHVMGQMGFDYSSFGSWKIFNKFNRFENN